MTWQRFLALVLCGYLIANILFAFGYMAAGIEHLNIQPSGSYWQDYLECFFFSTQCFTTIGFGRVNPQGITSNILASLEGLVGLLSLAMATGLLYGRFSRPRAHLLHSDNLLFAPYRENLNAVMFRIASTRRHSILIDNSVSLSFGYNYEENGTTKRRFFFLNLELDKINFLSSSWTLVHPITEDSPLWGMDYEAFMKSRGEFMILFKALEETTSQTVLERFSYFVDEVVWGAKFDSMIGTTSDGKPTLNLHLLNSWKETSLN
jgi:inward rectifier potassium channel